MVERGKKTTSWKGRHVISIRDFSRNDLTQVLKNADKMHGYLQKGKVPQLLEEKVLATLFFEPSTRTRLSFETAMRRLGGRVIGFAEPGTTSRKKGETTADTVRMASGYADIIVMRHPNAGAAKLASEVSEVPLINGGDGPNQHPTQTMLDMFTVYKEIGKLDGLKIAVVGDLKYGRTVHSLCTAMQNYEVEFRFIAPEALALPREYKQMLKESNHKFEETEEFNVAGMDVVYMTRIQKERFPDPTDYEKLKGVYVMDMDVVSTMKKKSIIMHPLPRVDEITAEVDSDPRAKYFEQAYYGVPTRMALLAMVMGAI
jgi:aspartate carbamoyltransferase catalytic subunit